MVVIDTKKIFITILVSVLLLVGSALTAFALEYDFEFSAPNYNDSDIYFLDYEGYGYMMYNYINIDDEQRYFQYVGSFMSFYNYETIDTTKKYHLSLSQYGFDFLSQNGANAQSMKSVLEDFIDGNVGNITVLWGKFSPVVYYIFDSGESLLASDYQDNPQFFDVISDLNNQFFNYESQYNDILSRYNALYTQHQDLISRYNVLEGNFMLLETNYNNVVYENEILRAEAQNYERNLQLANDQIERLNLMVGTLESDLNNALLDVENLQHDINNYQIVISDLEIIISQLETELETTYMAGYTSAIEEINAFESGIYTIFSSPFVIVGELSQIEIFGASITKIVGIILLFVILSIVLAFLWKVIPFV